MAVNKRRSWADRLGEAGGFCCSWHDRLLLLPRFAPCPQHSPSEKEGKERTSRKWQTSAVSSCDRRATLYRLQQATHRPSHPRAWIRWMKELFTDSTIFLSFILSFSFIQRESLRSPACAQPTPIQETYSLEWSWHHTHTQIHKDRQADRKKRRTISVLQILEFS